MSRRPRGDGHGRRSGDKGLSGIELLDGATMGELQFRSSAGAEFDYLVFEVLGDRFEKLGLAVGEVTEKYEVNSDGMFIDLTYRGTDSSYYQWYIDNKGKAGGLPADPYHHLCRRPASRCCKNFAMKDVVHVQKWAPISRNSASDLLESWGCPKLPPLRGPPRKPETEVNSERRDRRQGGVQALPAPKVEDVEEEEVLEEAEPEEPRPAVKRRKKALPQGRRQATALDAMLDDTVGDQPGESKDNKVEKKLGQLRAKLLGKKAETKGKEPGSVLAGRAMEAAEKGKPRRPRGDGMTRTIQKALLKAGRSRGSKDEASSEDSEGEAEDDDDELDLGGSGGWEQRRRKLRKVAEEKPGKLLLSGLQSMQEQLGQITGDDSSEAMSPIMVRYLLTMVLPAHPVKTIGESKYRELRTLCQVLDALLKGKVDTAGDILMQRFKCQVMSLRDNSEKFGRYLELIPEDMVAVSPEETFFARDLAHKTARADKLLG